MPAHTPALLGAFFFEQSNSHEKQRIAAPVPQLWVPHTDGEKKKRRREVGVPSYVYDIQGHTDQKEPCLQL